MKKPYPLLENAPTHHSSEFIDYLRKNNVVVLENSYWIVVENCKYHTPEKPWHTDFYKPNTNEAPFGFRFFLDNYSDWEWRKKRGLDQTVKRFHIHLIK